MAFSLPADQRTTLWNSGQHFFQTLKGYTVETRFCGRVYKAVRSYTIDTQYGQSLLGRLVICNIAEISFGLIGATMGELLLGPSIASLGAAIPIAAASMSLYKMSGRTTQVALATIGISIAVISQPLIWGALSSWGASLGFGFGGWLGAHAGTIIGGYAGLKLVDSEVPFWDDSASCDCYLIGMIKFLLAGDVFNQVIVKPSFSYSPLSWARMITAVIVKACAYNSGTVVTIFKNIFREKKVEQEVIFPLVVRSFFSKYCQKNAVPITEKMIRLFTANFEAYPRLARSVKGLLRCFVCDLTRETLISLGNNSDKLIAAIMRAFPSYIELASKFQEEDISKLEGHLKDAIQQSLEIRGKRNWFQLFKLWCEQNMKMIAAQSIDINVFDKQADAILKGILEMEMNVFGVAFEKGDRIKPLLGLHIKYFLIYLLVHVDLRQLTKEEEKAFFLKSSEIFFSLYRPNELPIAGKTRIKQLQQKASYFIWNGISGTIHSLISSFYFAKMHLSHFIYKPEERAVLLSPKIITDDVKEDEFNSGPLTSYFPIPPKSSEFIAVDDDLKTTVETIE